MTISEQLMEDMKTAMRERNQIKLGIIRLLRSEIKNEEIDKGILDDQAVQKVIGRLVKQLKEALLDIKKSGRDELVAEEEAKIAVLEEYLPAQLSDEELVATIKTVMTESGETHQGKLTGLVSKQLQGKADGSRIAATIATIMAS